MGDKAWVKVKYLKDWYAYSKDETGIVSRVAFNCLVKAGIVEEIG